jgi:hypothetical protein
MQNLGQLNISEVLDYLETEIAKLQPLATCGIKVPQSNARKKIGNLEKQITLLLTLPMNSKYPKNCKLINVGDCFELSRTYMRLNTVEKSNKEKADITIGAYTYELKSLATLNKITVNMDSKDRKAEFLLDDMKIYRVDGKVYREFCQMFANQENDGRYRIKPNPTTRNFVKANGKVVFDYNE